MFVHQLEPPETGGQSWPRGLGFETPSSVLDSGACAPKTITESGKALNYDREKQLVQLGGAKHTATPASLPFFRVYRLDQASALETTRDTTQVLVREIGRLS